MKITKNESFITTIDNPWNPFTHFDDWNHFDCEEKNYCTFALINRMIQSEYPNDFEAESNEEIVNEMCERIVSEFPNLYKFVYGNITEETIDINEIIE